MKTLIVFFGYIIICLCVLSCQSYDSYEEYPVKLTHEQFSEYYKQFQGRFLLWKEALGIPEFDISSRDFWPFYNFYEFPSTSNTTCYFRAPKVILVGNDMWQSGCVPHEIGHAVLYTLGHLCWVEFEHPNEENKCKERFK